jgi:tetratricopeptide (TPR) repeat protein
VRELRRLLERRFGRDPLARARRARAGGQVDEARRLLDEAERTSPGDPEAPLERAELELAALGAGSGDVEAARKGLRDAIERAIALDPAYDCLHYRAAILHLRAGEPERARERIGRLLEINPRYRPRLEWEMTQAGSPLARLKGTGIPGPREN